MRKFLIPVLSAFALFAGAASANVKVGDVAPAFTLKGADGKEHSLSDFKGNIVVLEWSNPNCPYVKKFYEGGDMQAEQAKQKSKGVAWLTINSSAEGKEGYLTDKDAATLVADKKINSDAYLLDADGKVGKTYGATNTPHMFIVDKEGKIAYQGAPDSIPSADKADIAKSENYVNAAVDSLIAGKDVATKVTKAYGCGVKYAD